MGDGRAVPSHLCRASLRKQLPETEGASHQKVSRGGHPAVLALATRKTAEQELAITGSGSKRRLQGLPGRGGIPSAATPRERRCSSIQASPGTITTSRWPAGVSLEGSRRSLSPIAPREPETSHVEAGRPPGPCANAVGTPDHSESDGDTGRRSAFQHQNVNERHGKIDLINVISDTRLTSMPGKYRERNLSGGRHERCAAEARRSIRFPPTSGSLSLEAAIAIRN